ncbi:hypothetical protein QAD02_008149 [Eretmocerus hayati]|uniref:Uncharacterized protein n=1 Tax=Eretmocerus hayati TaxID=131215 RepID=A0ACC2N5Y6_9HYME|nr:hypothetical protein QAD02_008149 [Eretmocerus hayati]
MSAPAKTVKKKLTGSENEKREAQKDEQFERDKQFMCIDKYTVKFDGSAKKSRLECSPRKEPSEAIGIDVTLEDSSPEVDLSRTTEEIDSVVPSDIVGCQDSDSTSCENQDLALVSSDIGKWPTHLNKSTINYLIEKGAEQIFLKEYPQDKQGRHFSNTHYSRQISGGESLNRQWLVYSVAKDAVFCFCCKFFDKISSNTRWNSTGHNDWKHLGDKLVSPNL